MNALREIFAHCPVVLEEPGMKDLIGAYSAHMQPPPVVACTLPVWRMLCKAFCVIIHNAWLSKGWRFAALC